MKSRRSLTTALTGMTLCAVLAGCASVRDSVAGLTAPSAQADTAASVEILRLPYGVPRIIASDHEGLGFGAGFVAAEDNLCLLMDRAMTVRGERAAFLGAGENNANIASDVYHRRIRNAGTVEALLAGEPGAVDTPSDDARAFIEGFADGVNHVLANTVTGDPNCAGQAWVRELSPQDIWYGALTLPFGQPIQAVTSAEPPAGADATHSEARVEDLLVQRRGMGSNAYAVGSDGTREDVNAVLLGNPHYPWDGALRFYRVGLTIPGELNVVGAGLITTPFVGIGHTENIAWTHTVSTARRFGYYELTLDPADPTRYLIDGASRAMMANNVTVEVLGENGETTPVTRTIWETEFGPVAVSQRMPWSAETAFAFAAPSGGLRIIDQYLAMYEADNVETLHDALSRYQATAFNTMAVDHQGGAFYGDMGLVPNVDTALVMRCAVSELAQGYWMRARIPILDASDSSCRWQDGDQASAPGVFGPADAPHLFRPDFVAQSNDSPWLTNPAEPLTGYSPIWGDEATPRSMRTRLALDQIAQRLAGTDGLGEAGFDLETVQAVMYSNRHHGGELLRDSVVEVCEASGDAALQPLCDALAGWDLKVNLNSTGAHVMALYLLAGGDVFAGAFDAENGATTPVGLASDNPAVLAALRSAAEQLAQLQLAPDAPLGDVMGEMRGETRIPIHGGPSGTGVFNMIIPGSPVPGTGWTSVRHGSSWIMTVEFSDEGVRSEGVLTYSQSTDPTSPHYGDQTRLYSEKGWEALYLDIDEARAAAVSTSIIQR
ncbi:penicillin acylase family protein [Maricaulis sp.]|uniref:penicillin acylase family protein n=1 Tax=Maricaulis sp. TaxID=1486257 RepID=UPI00260A4DE2|nr:penicillin acylase family protein [Maricaulis sp.]